MFVFNSYLILLSFCMLGLGTHNYYVLFMCLFIYLRFIDQTIHLFIQLYVCFI